MGSIYLDIPLNMLPSLKHFALKSNKWVEIKGPDRDVSSTSIDREGEALRVLGVTRPALQTITIHIPEPEIATGWVRRILHRQKDQGEWDKFRELVIVDGDGEEEEDMTETYVGDAALSWCDNDMWSVCVKLIFH